MKKVLMIVGAVLLAALLSAGSFYGGMAYQRNQANQIRASFLRSRGLSDGASNGNNGFGQRGGFFGRGGQGGGGVFGQVKSLEGNVLTLSTAQNVVRVNLTNSTRIEKPAPATTSDLQPNVRVQVTGQRDSNGNITASQINIINTNPPSAETAP